MVSKFSLFMATAQYNFLRFIPGKKQQFFEYLEELSENVQTDFFCQDILEVWLENFGIGGLVLGSAALFSIGFILMIAADIIIWRTGSTVVTSLVRICSGLYCFEKFRGSSYYFSINQFKRLQRCDILYLGDEKWLPDTNSVKKKYKSLSRHAKRIRISEQNQG